MDLLEPSRLRLPPWIKRVEYSRTIDSTNDAARRLSAEMPREAGLFVTAEEQTVGRGRGSNRWWTGPGSLAFSLLFDPAGYGIETRYGAMVPLSAAIALVEVVRERLPSHDLGIHWPNDVFLGERKLAGILVEGLPDGRQILGVGCNVNNSVTAAPPEIASIVATLSDEMREPLDRTELLSDLVAAIDVTLALLGKNRKDLGVLADRLCLQRGRMLHVQVGEERVGGVCTGIADDGALQLDTPAGRRAIYSGIVLKS